MSDETPEKPAAGAPEPTANPLARRGRGARAAKAADTQAAPENAPETATEQPGTPSSADLDADAAEKKAKEATGPVNLIVDRRGTVFDPEKHATFGDGTPHADSAGNFILKEHHYDGAKKAFYPDSFRHA